MSQRLADTGFEAARTADPLLEAARACVLAVGVRRTTFSDVARRAGVSRMTLYRRYPDLDALLSALMTYEFGAIVEAARCAAGADATCRERVVAMTVHGCRALSEDPLFERILDLDPELLLPYVTRRLGAMQQMAVAGIEAELSAADESVRAGEPAVMAVAIELIARGFVLGAHAEQSAARSALDPWAELERAIDGYLRP